MIEISAKDAKAIVDFLSLLEEYILDDEQGAQSIALHAVIVKVELERKLHEKLEG